MADQRHDEIDLGFIFQKIGNVYNGFLATLYRILRFFRKHWIIIALMIIGGAVAGNFWMKSIKYDKDATVILTANFNSTNYVYDAVELLLRKTKQKDGAFLRKYGFDPKDREIEDLVIEPIVNLFDLLEKSETNDRNLEQYLDQSDFEEDVLLSDIFIPEYKYHRLYITTTEFGTNETIQKIIDYLNSNEVYRQTQEVMVAQITDQIEQNKRSIELIDDVFDVHGDKSLTEQNPGEIYFRLQDVNNLHMLMTSKNELLEKNEELAERLILAQNIVTVVNEPNLKFMYGPFSDKRIILPLGLLTLYIFVFLFRSFYAHIREVYMARNSQ